LFIGQPVLGEYQATDTGENRKGCLETKKVKVN
jgi:hypothetical protein